MTIGLLRKPSIEPWDEFTCLNSLRDVEPTVNLILDDGGLDDDGGDDAEDEGGRPMSNKDSQTLQGRRTAAQPGAHDVRHRLDRRPAEPVGHGDGPGRLAGQGHRGDRRGAAAGLGAGSAGAAGASRCGRPRSCRTLIRSTSSMTRRWSASRSPRFPAGWSARTVGGWPRSSSGLFKLETPYRTDQIRYVHANCTKPGKPPTVVPARFIVACKNGHLDDFPWREFVHRGPTNCKGGLKLLETSATGEAASIVVQCEGENCGAIRRMSDAFKMDLMALPVCKARRPHLRDHDEAGCKAPNGQDMRMEPMLQGASNSWFGIMLSALAIPQASGKLAQLVEDHWTILEKVQSEQNIELLAAGDAATA